MPVELIERRIYLIRGHKVMVDVDLAELYEVEVRALVQAVKRNPDRFPEDFMFQLTANEAVSLRSQFVISKTTGRGGRRYLPYAFTEQGVAMLSSVLRSSSVPGHCHSATAIAGQVFESFKALARFFKRGSSSRFRTR